LEAECDLLKGGGDWERGRGGESDSGMMLPEPVEGLN